MFGNRSGSSLIRFNNFLVFGRSRHALCSIDKNNDDITDLEIL